MNRKSTALSLYRYTTARVDTGRVRVGGEPGVGGHELDWQAEAACVQYAGRVDFFATSHDALQAAKVVCAGCAVRDECLEFAMQKNLRSGVWGGLDERERRRLRRMRRRLSGRRA